MKVTYRELGRKIGTLGMWVDDVAVLVWRLATTDPRFANGTGQRVEYDFNGVPLTAYATDAHPQVVTLRWHYEMRIKSCQAGYLALSELSLL
jgi:hypothetical protein